MKKIISTLFVYTLFATTGIQSVNATTAKHKAVKHKTVKQKVVKKKIVKPKTITVKVKKLNPVSETGDGYTFTATNGKEYYVYNAEWPVNGERYITPGKTICITLINGDGLGDVKSVAKGKCRP